MAITFNTNNTIVDSDSGFGAFNNGDIIIVQDFLNSRNFLLYLLQPKVTSFLL